MAQCYDFLSNDDIQMIHEASLEVLETTGLRMNHPLALEKFSAAGARVDKSTGQVHLPVTLIEDALQTAPKTFVCAGRDSAFDITVSPGSMAMPHVRSAAGSINYYDLIENKYRPIRLQDCRDLAKLMDGLDTMKISGCLVPEDAPPETYDLHAFKSLLESGRNHIWALPKNSDNLKYQLEMMKAVAGGTEALRQRPICSGIVCLIEPLYFPNDEIERLLLYGECNLPVKVPLVPMFGANAPFTLAGALTHTNAEALGALVLLQTLCPGIPTWYYTLLSEIDMLKGTAHYLNPEIMMIYSGLTQLARHYQIPSCSLSFASTDCQIHQLLFERGTALTMFALSGVSELGGAGGVDGAIAISPLLLVIDDEIAAYMRRILEGIEIDRERLAVEAINRVGHHGSFLGDPHTLQFLRREHRFKPTLFDWRSYETWSRDTSTIVERARDKMHDILNTHEVPSLDEPLQRELDSILLNAEKRSAHGLSSYPKGLP